MIDHEKDELTVNGLTEPIAEWRTWFITMQGTHPNIADAKKSCDSTGQPYFMIKPVPVAIGKTTFEVVNW